MFWRKRKTNKRKEERISQRRTQNSWTLKITRVKKLNWEDFRKRHREIGNQNQSTRRKSEEEKWKRKLVNAGIIYVWEQSIG